MDLNDLMSHDKAKPKEKVTAPIKKSIGVDNSFHNVMDSVATNWVDHAPKESKDKEIEALRLEIEMLKRNNSASLVVKNNLKKIVDAIKVESFKQKTNWPVISTNKLRKNYKVNSHSWASVLEYAEANNIFERKEASHSGLVKTFKWRLF
ncbi:MAG: hypothetical protein HN576_09530 [Bacteriovoracaceae bacterium]|nr:hypothetical protein [Bacteriovoracaceae bacterium]